MESILPRVLPEIRMYTKRIYGDSIDLEILDMFMKHIVSVKHSERLNIISLYSGFPFIKKILTSLDNPHYLTHISRHTINKKRLAGSKVNSNYDHILDLIEDLQNNKFEGVITAVKHVRHYIFSRDQYHRTLIFDIFDKNLKTYLRSKDIFKGLGHIPAPKLKARLPFENFPGFRRRLRLFDHNWYALEYFHGVPIYAIVDNYGKCIIYGADNSIRVQTMFSIIRDINKLRVKSCVYIGYVMYLNTDGTQNITQAKKVKYLQNGNRKRWKFCIYDKITLDEYNSGISKTPYIQRYSSICSDIDKFKREDELNSNKHREFDPGLTFLYIPRMVCLNHISEYDMVLRQTMSTFVDFIMYKRDKNGYWFSDTYPVKTKMNGMMLIRHDHYNNNINNLITSIRINDYTEIVVEVHNAYPKKCEYLYNVDNNGEIVENADMFIHGFKHTTIKTFYSFLFMYGGIRHTVYAGFTLTERNEIYKNGIENYIGRKIKILYQSQQKFGNKIKLKDVIFNGFVEKELDKLE